MDKLDLAALRQAWGNNPDVLALIAAVEALLVLPTPPPGANAPSDYGNGYDSGFNAYRREAKRLFGVEE